MKMKFALRGLLFLGALVAIGFTLKALGVDSLFNKAWVDNEIRGHGLSGQVLFLGAGALFASVGLPRQMVGFLGGYAFGFLAGSLLALCAALSGCILTFYYARLLGRRFVVKHFAKRVRKVDEFIHDNTFTMTLLIRLLPAGSNLITNLAAGVSSVRSLPFFAGTALGYLPQMMIFAMVGSGINLDPGLRIGVGALLFVISGVLGIYLYREYRHGKSLDEALEQELGALDGEAPTTQPGRVPPA